MNPVDIIVLGLVILLLAACVISIRKTRKTGVPSCGAKSCASCALGCTCAMASKKNQ